MVHNNRKKGWYKLSKSIALGITFIIFGLLLSWATTIVALDVLRFILLASGFLFLVVGIIKKLQSKTALSAYVTGRQQRPCFHRTGKITPRIVLFTSDLDMPIFNDTNLLQLGSYA